MVQLQKIWDGPDRKNSGTGENLRILDGPYFLFLNSPEFKKILNGPELKKNKSSTLKFWNGPE